MSRSYHQRHGWKRKGKHYSYDIMGYHPDYDPSKPISEFWRISQGKDQYIWRHRKTKPYGRKNHIGWGEESYTYKYRCEFMQPEVDKGAYRQQLKREITNFLKNNV